MPRKHCASPNHPITVCGHRASGRSIRRGRSAGDARCLSAPVASPSLPTLGVAVRCRRPCRLVGLLASRVAARWGIVVDLYSPAKSGRDRDEDRDDPDEAPSPCGGVRPGEDPPRPPPTRHPSRHYQRPGRPATAATKAHKNLISQAVEAYVDDGSGAGLSSILSAKSNSLPAPRSVSPSSRGNARDGRERLPRLRADSSDRTAQLYAVQRPNLNQTLRDAQQATKKPRNPLRRS